MKIKKKLLTFFSVITSTTILVSLSATALSLGQNSFNVSPNNISNRAWTDGNSQDEATITVSFKNKQKLEETPELANFKAKTVDELTAADIRLFLDFQNNTSSNIMIEITPPTEDDIVTGNLKFKVWQNKRKNDGTYEKVAIKYTPNDGGSSNSKDQWTLSDAKENDGSSSLSKYVKSKKYNWIWISDKEMETLFGGETKYTQSDLTKEFVLKNLVSSDAILPKQEDISVAINDVGNGSSSGSYGVKKVNVTFTGSATDPNKWEGNNTPQSKNSAKAQEIIIRCLAPEAGQTSEMTLKQRDTTSIGEINISDTSMFGSALTGTESKVKDLLPSEFVGVIQKNSNDANTLNNMLLQGTGLDNTPFVEIEYMGKKVTESDFETSTGLKTSDHKVTKIRTIPNDKDGSLQIIYTYNGLNIYNNKVEEKNVSQLIPAGTFKTSQDGNKILKFAWKKEESIETIGTSYNFVNQYARNQNEHEYLKWLTNQMFVGTTDTYNQDREVKIDYDISSSSHSESPVEGTSGIWWDSTSQSETAYVELTFPSWAGATYTDENTGEIKEGFKTTKEFTFNGYKIEGFDVYWSTQEELMNKDKTLKHQYPSEIVEKISGPNNDKQIPQDMFFKLNNTNTYETDIAFIPDDSSGTIRVLIRAVDRTTSNSIPQTIAQFQQIYTGMKATCKVNDDSIKEYAWLPAIEINQELLAKNIDEVTKTDILNLYLKEIPMFKDFELTIDDFEMETISIDNVDYIEIKVTIDSYNADDVSSTRTFINRISGFSTHKSSGDFEYDSPIDITTTVSVITSTFITVVLLTILVSLISKRARLRKFADLKTNKKSNKKQTKTEE